MCFRQVLAIGVITFKKIRYCIQPEAIYSHFAPVIEYIEYFFLYRRAVIIQIGLVMVETVPVILLCSIIPCPVGCFKILEYNAGVSVLIRIIAPYIIISVRGIF